MYPQDFRADHTYGVVRSHGEIGLNAASLLKLSWEFFNFKPTAHELRQKKKTTNTQIQRQLTALKK